MPLEGGKCLYCDSTESHFHSFEMGRAGAGIEAEAAKKVVNRLQSAVKAAQAIILASDGPIPGATVQALLFAVEFDNCRKHGDLESYQ